MKPDALDNSRRRMIIGTAYIVGFAAVGAVALLAGQTGTQGRMAQVLSQLFFLGTSVALFYLVGAGQIQHQVHTRTARRSAVFLTCASILSVWAAGLAIENTATGAAIAVVVIGVVGAAFEITSETGLPSRRRTQLAVVSSREHLSDASRNLRGPRAHPHRRKVPRPNASKNPKLR